MRRRDHHAYHDFTQNKAVDESEVVDHAPPDPFRDYDITETQETASINQRLARMNIRKTAPKLVDQIPGPELPSTLSISGNSREPVPEIPEERELAQAAVDDGAQGMFRTFQDTCPPPADCQYNVVDQGVSGPNFFRCSMYNVPFSEKLRKISQLPLALYLRPFAEVEVPLADFSQFDGEEMPPRCHRCRAYMNPSMRFIHGGAKFVCNLCLFVNNTPPEYYQPTGPDGKRLDWEERPELAFGTYDFLVIPALARNGGSEPRQGVGLGASAPHPQNHREHTEPLVLEPNADFSSVYGKPVPQEFRRIYCCECGRDAVQKNTIALFAECVLVSLPYLGKNDRIAIMTFDTQIHYFRLNSNNEVQMLTCSAENPVVPPDVFIDPETQLEGLQKLLERLPTFFEGTGDRTSCLGNALESILDLQSSSQGGRITAMFSSLPSVGSSRLTMRDTAIAGVTSPEAPMHKELFEPTSRFYGDLLNKYTENGWGCDLLAIPTTGYLDVANLGKVARGSGGKFFHYPRFVAERDSRRVIGDMLSIVSAPMQARNTKLKIRTSTGLQIDKYYGGGDGNAGFLDSDSTIVATAVYDGQLDPKLDAHFQAAILYTAPSGEQRIRVFNLLTGVTPKLKPLLKFVDIDVIIATITRQTLSQLGKHSIQDLRQAILAKIEGIFGSARLHAGQGMPLTQLLMPTNLRLLLMYGLSLTKTIALGSRSFSCDARVVSANYLSEATVNQLSLALYPRVYDIGKLYTSSKLPMARARFADLMLGSHAFLVFDGQQIFIWLSELVSRSVLIDLFGVETLEQVSAWTDELPIMDTDLSKQARQLCAELAYRVDRSWIPVQIVRQSLDGAEYQLRQLMVEDTINDSPSYINYVVRVHHAAKEYSEKETWF